MAKNSRTHYRKVYKSDHLGVADLEEMQEDGKALCFTIKHVKQELNVSVAGRKGDYNIAYFVEDIKPLVLNATNAAMVRKLSGGSAFIEDWANTPVELFINSNVKMAGSKVGGVRIKDKKPVVLTMEEVKEKIAQATIVKELTRLTPEIKKYDLSLLARERAAEIKKQKEDAATSED